MCKVKTGSFLINQRVILQFLLEIPSNDADGLTVLQMYTYDDQRTVNCFQIYRGIVCSWDTFEDTHCWKRHHFVRSPHFRWNHPSRRPSCQKLRYVIEYCCWLSMIPVRILIAFDE